MSCPSGPQPVAAQSCGVGMRHRRASISVAQLVLRGRFGSTRRRRRSPPVPAAAAASCRFWPFWRGRALHAHSDNSVCASADSWQLAARQDAPFPGDLCGLCPLFRYAAFCRSPRSVTLALEPFAHRLAVSADRLGLLAHSSLRWLFRTSDDVNGALRVLKKKDAA